MDNTITRIRNHLNEINILIDQLNTNEQNATEYFEEMQNDINGNNFQEKKEEEKQNNNNHSLNCSECGKPQDPIKGAKVIEFSNKKFGKTICYFCQKKM